MFFEIQAKHTKDLYNLDLVFNGLNQASKIFQNNWEVIPQKFKNYRQKKKERKKELSLLVTFQKQLNFFQAFSLDGNNRNFSQTYELHTF